MKEFGRKFAESLVGMEVEEARKLAEDNGMLIRVCQEDGLIYAGTCDFRPNRVNIIVSEGKVTSIIDLG